MYWFAHKTYSADILVWIRQCMKRLENWCLSGLEIPLATIPYMFSTFPHTFPHVSSIFFLVSLGISHVAPGVYPCFLFRSYKSRKLWKPVFRPVIRTKDNFLFLFFESLDFTKSPTTTFAQATRICHLDIKDNLLWKSCSY